MHGETVLITGGARRIGRAIAVSMAGQGFDVAIHYNQSRDAAMSLIDELRALGVTACAVQGELGNAEGCAAFLGSCGKAAGPVHHLVNNAFIFPTDTLDEFTAESLASNHAINTMAPFILSSALKDAGTLRSVTNLLDARVTDYDHKHVSYHLSKRALMALTSMMALEWAPGVRVNAVAPGLILPPEGENEEYLAALANSNPLQKVGNEYDVCDAVAYLINSTFVTGQIMYVDGGRHLKGRVYE